MKVGHGVSGAVEVHRKKNHVFVTKTYHEREKYETKGEYKKRVLHEYDVLARLDNEHFIHVFKYTVLLMGNTIRVFMDAGSEANVYEQVRKMTAKEVEINRREMLCVWKQVALGVAYLHEQGLCHRDLKLDNAVFHHETGLVKIIDLATATDGRKARGIVGSPNYMAPEMTTAIEYSGWPVDMWSLGVMACFLLKKQFPWKLAHVSDSEFKVFCHGGVDGLCEAFFGDLPDECPLVHLLTVDPATRVSLEQLLHNNWFSTLALCSSTVSCGHHLMK